MSPTLPIKHWPARERPRERLIANGARTLSDAELLAVFLRVGVQGCSAVELGEQLLRHFGSINAMFGASVTEFSRLHGLGPAKFAQLNAVMELARRATGEEWQLGKELNRPELVKQYLRTCLHQRSHEVFLVLFLDVKHRLIASEEMFRGTLTQTSVYPREVVKAALRHNAASVMLAHNHPSGSPEPSQADRLLTSRLTEALALVDVRVLDHFVVAGHQVHAFSEHGEL
jgi:DNA repair protein RadC